MTAPINSDLEGFLRLPVATPVAQVQQAAAKVATDESTLIAGLKRASWPGAVQATITNLEQTGAKEQPVFQAAAAAPSVAAIKTVLTQNQATIAARAAAANQVRLALGIPAATPSASAAPPASSSATA